MALQAILTDSGAFPAHWGTKMTDLLQLLIGIALIIIGIGSLIACVPRSGKAAWFVGNSFLEPIVPILMVTTLAVGFVMVAGFSR